MAEITKELLDMGTFVLVPEPWYDDNWQRSATAAWYDDNWPRSAMADWFDDNWPHSVGYGLFVVLLLTSRRLAPM